MEEFKIRLKKRRLAMGLTLAQVAEKLDMTEGTIQRYESGEIKNIKYGTITKLAQILNCTPPYLLGWEDNCNNNNVINCNNSVVANGMNSKAISEKNLCLTPQENELIHIYQKLDIKNQTKLLSYAFELENKE